VAAALRGLGGVYTTRQRWEEARAAYVRSLEIDEAVLGPDHPELAHALNNLSGVYFSLGDPAQ
jgi:Tetratricopeptide repeat